MTLAELITRFRSSANDTVQPYFWSDEQVTQWLNDAEAEAAIRGRLIHESDRENMCRIEVEAGRSSYKLHAAMFELTSVALLNADGSFLHNLELVSTEHLDSKMQGWRYERGLPRYVVQTDTGLRLNPEPTEDAILAVEGFRLPKSQMEDDEDSPEINSAHHRHLVCWALHIGFSIPDAELFDSRRSELAKEEFETYFGLQVDSDMRRVTRHDEPHHVNAFWV